MYVVRASIRAEMGSLLTLAADLLRLTWFALFSKEVGLRAESLTVIGKAFTKARVPSVGILLLRSAVRLHKVEFDAKRSGPEFVVKAYKHLIDAYRTRGDDIKANKALETALTLARKSGIDDQVRQLEDLRK